VAFVLAICILNAPAGFAEDFGESIPKEPDITTVEAAEDPTALANELNIDCKSKFILVVGPANTKKRGSFKVQETVVADSQEEAELLLKKTCPAGAAEAEDDAKKKAVAACELLVEQSAIAYSSGQQKAECKDVSDQCDQGRACKSVPTIKNESCIASIAQNGRAVAGPTAIKLPDNKRFLLVCDYYAWADARGGVSFSCGGCE